MRAGLHIGLWMALTFSLPALAKIRSEADYWRKTKLSREFTAKFIDNAKCRSTETYLNSCRAAMRAGRVFVNAPDLVLDDDFEKSMRRLEAALAKGGPPVQMLRAQMINAHLAAFDPYAALKPSEMLMEGFGAEEQNYVGIGVVLEPSIEGLRVHEVSDPSPAFEAGLREDDILLAVAKDGEGFRDTEADMNKAAALIAGEEGTRLAVRVSRGGSALELPMKRGYVEVPLVTSEVLGEVGYLRVLSFESYSVCRHVIRHLERMQGVEKMILDLRGNPGGEKAMAVCVSELFLGPRTVVGIKSTANEIPQLKTLMEIENGDPAGDAIRWEGGYVARPKFEGALIVLIDATSASGAEIVAGAMQDHGRAWLVGERSFGKGTVQSEEFVPGYPTLSLKWTIERFYQPRGRANQGAGISPNFEVPRRKGMDLNAVRRLRESDLNPNSPAAAENVWQETRPAETARIRECIRSARADEEALQALAARGDYPDYQKAYALAVLQCE